MHLYQVMLVLGSLFENSLMYFVQNALDMEVMIDLTKSDDEDEPTAKRQPPPSLQLPPPAPSSLPSLPASLPASQVPSIQRVSSVSLPSHDSLSAQHSVPSQPHYPSQQQHHRTG